MVAAPRKEPILTDTPFFSNIVIASPNDVNLPSFQYGPGDVPSPNISKVTPCLRSDNALPSSIRELYPQLNMFIKPGETARPVASITVSA